MHLYFQHQANNGLNTLVDIRTARTNFLRFSLVVITIFLIQSVGSDPFTLLKWVCRSAYGEAMELDH